MVENTLKIELLVLGEIQISAITFTPCLKRFHRISHLFKHPHIESP